jgi:hypothetical protein
MTKIEAAAGRSAVVAEPGEMMRAGGVSFEAKKTARTLSCPCREASDANYFRLGRSSFNCLIEWNKSTIAYIPDNANTKIEILLRKDVQAFLVGGTSKPRRSLRC